jgi:GntR family transcriptional regulator
MGARTEWFSAEALDAEGPAPLHYQLREILRFAIARGSFPDGRLPSERALMERFGVSRATVREAITALDRERLVRRVHGRGTFVVQGQLVEWLGTLRGYNETIQAMGFSPGIRLVEQGWTHAGEAAATFLRQQRVFRLQRLRLADDEPVALETAFYPPEIGRGLEEVDLRTALVYEVLEGRLGVLLDEAEQTIRGGLAGPREAELLRVDEGAPVLLICRRTTSTRGGPVEWLETIYRGDRYSYGIRLRRRRGEPLAGSARTGVPKREGGIFR